MGFVASLKCSTDEGEIKGNQQKEGRKDEIGVRSARHMVKSNTDLETGMPKGAIGGGRVFDDFVIVKKIDLASPYFQKALINNSEFKTWRLNFYHLPFDGQECAYASVTLKGARISSIKMVMPNLGVPANVPVHEYEEVSFQFEQIGWGVVPKGNEGSGNVTEAAESDCIPEPDWALEELKLFVMGFPKLVSSAKKALWEDWKTRNGGKEIPAEYAKD